MSVSTYAELKTAIANWLERSNLTSRIPEFIVIAESEIAKKLRCRYNEKRITADISKQYSDMPTNFLEMRNFQVNSDPLIVLKYKTPEQQDWLYPSTSLTDYPMMYTVIGTEVEVKPVPNKTYEVEMAYWYRLTAFSGDTDTNDLLINHPEVYIYGACAAAMPFLDKNSPDFLSLFEKTIFDLNQREQWGRFSGGALQSTPRHRPE